ncbi:MAG: phosphatidate cytidylyltransferase [Clostridia bacterium]|nr:phosphatidate cytidylyltransferase [Clostridia bacterium]
MRTRVITAVVAVGVIFPFFWWSAPLGRTAPLSYLFPGLFALLSLFAVWELLHCVSLDKNYAISVPLYLAALAFPVLARVLENSDLFIRIFWMTALVMTIYLFGVIIFRFGKVDMGKIALVGMTSFYIIGAFSAVVLLRDMTDSTGLVNIGKYIYLIPFIFGWVTDTFAYFCGRLFGRHKLIPTVSPKKTVEGAIGGIVFCALATWLYGFIVGKCFDVTPNYLALILTGLVVSVVSMIGDLVMSAIKREYGIKDYGKLLPGHGGILDRFDSSIAVTVLLLVISSFVPLFEVV